MPKIQWQVSVQEKEKKTLRRQSRQCEYEDREWSSVTAKSRKPRNAKECRQPLAKRCEKNSFPEVGNTAPTTPLLWHSGHERILFFFFNYHICGSLHCERKLIEMEIRRWRWENDMIDYYMEGRQVCTRENPGKYSS